ADLGFQSDRKISGAAGILETGKEFERQRKDHKAGERTAHDEQNRRGKQIRQESRSLFFIETRRYEHPELARDHRERQTDRGPESDAQIREERLGQVGIDEMAVGFAVRISASGSARNP